MKNILLIEPDYRSKFPPLGLLRISSFHKARGDSVTFARGCHEDLRNAHWHRVYIASLFTWELPRTIRTIEFYRPSVARPENIVVGGIGATLMPEYITERVSCTVISGPVDRKGRLARNAPSLEKIVPDYSIVDSGQWNYQPTDAYFCRTTKGCVRRCRFCAVPHLEPRFARNRYWRMELAETRRRFGERRDLVLMDNNVLANDHIDSIIRGIRNEGFERGAKAGKRMRVVDFNQGIDARLVTTQTAKSLATINLKPVRLAFDFDGVEPQYRSAVARLANVGFRHFTNYLMFNFNDTPESLYRRMKVNLELTQRLDVAITGFPMRYIPIDDVDRRYVSPGWHWRYLRGIQCVLLATHGMVSPNPDFFAAAFGESYQEFIEILSMPDRYIVHREKFKNNRARDWRRRFRRLSKTSRAELLGILADLNRSHDKKRDVAKHKEFRRLLEHYYPAREAPRP
jgi:hypothetical protein